jgi:hypothetical protein
MYVCICVCVCVCVTVCTVCASHAAVGNICNVCSRLRQSNCYSSLSALSVGRWRYVTIWVLLSHRVCAIRYFILLVLACCHQMALGVSFVLLFGNEMLLTSFYVPCFMSVSVVVLLERPIRAVFRYRLVIWVSRSPLSEVGQ